MNKRKERKGKIQLIDASNIYHKLRKPLGNKKNELSPNDRKRITELYTEFKENENSKIYNNEEFIYKEYSVMQPLQRSYSITEESIQSMIQSGTLKNLWDDTFVAKLEELGTTISDKDKKKLNGYYKSKLTYDNILDTLSKSVSKKKWMSIDEFMPELTKIIGGIDINKSMIQKIANGLSVMDKNAVIQRDKEGNIIYDKDTKDIELVKFEENIEIYMEREVLPYVPDAKAFFEENLVGKHPVIKTGAEIPFTRYFYKYIEETNSEELKRRFNELEEVVNTRITKIFGGTESAKKERK